MAVECRPPPPPPPLDHLTALPSELLQNIISYLFPTHEPDKVLLRKAPRTPSHDLERLANTCRTLHHEVHAWAHHFLLHHQPITKFKPPPHAAPPSKRKKQPPSKPPTMSQTNHLRNRHRSSQALLTWSTTKCTFCGKPSTRCAILMNGLCCCSACDTTHWPDKITKTSALQEYHLKPYHLDTSLAQAWDPPHIASWIKAKSVRYGVYICQGGPTTMFLRKDVEARAREVHGQDWEEHLRRRKEGREKRREKWGENRKKKKLAEAERMREERVRREEAIVTGDLSDGDDDDDDERNFNVETVGAAGAEGVIVLD